MNCLKINTSSMKSNLESQSSTFDWKSYIKNYPDLSHLDKIGAINHYTRYGKKEGRTDIPNSTINNTSINLGGRFGNILFYNLVADYIARKIDLNFIYKNEYLIYQLGIDLYKGTKTYNEVITLTDENIHFIFKENVKKCNILINGYFQIPPVATYIRNHILELKEIIIKANPYYSISKGNNNLKSSISNNNLFVHVRLGDIIEFNGQEDYSYYNNTISEIIFDKGFISSDNINHSYCQILIKKYNLIPFEENEVSTIQFGSTCKHIVLSKGTFSWWIGVMAFDSSIWFPEKKNSKPWHGDIFIFDDWNKVIY